jgi:hypothetical protein
MTKAYFMDHEFAEKSGAADRYLMNEVTAEERVEFEAHFFDCALCSDKVRKGAIFVEAAKEIMRGERDEAIARNRRAVRKPARWLAWLTPATLTPSFAALALAIVVGYQNLVTLPALQKPQLLSTSVIAPLAREEAPVISIDPRLPHFNLNFMVDSSHVYPNYACQFTNERGTKILTMETGPRTVSSFTLSFLLPTRQFPPGHYELVVRPQTNPAASVQRYTFVVRTGDSQ